MNEAPFNPARVRADFPILSREIGGYPLTYLDNAATTQKPRAVIEALVDFYERHNANVHRGVHTLSEEASELYEQARAKVARFIGAPSPQTVVFTAGTTAGVNLVAQGWARPRLKSGDEILLTEMEHHSNIIPWQMAAKESGATLRYLPLREDGSLRMEAAERLVNSKTRLVAVTHTSNVLGTLNPIARLAELAHAVDAPILVDAAQAAPRTPLDVAALDCDFLVFSGHKMLGPTGIGVLYGKAGRLDEMEPAAGGGGMIRQVWEDRASWNELPWKFEAGTPNIAGAVGLEAAVDYLSALTLEAVQTHEHALTREALNLLAGVPGVSLYGGGTDPCGVISFNLDGIHPHDVAQVLDERGVAVRGGHHCCQLLMRRLGADATVRMSFAPYNDSADVERLVEGLARVRGVFGHG